MEQNSLIQNEQKILTQREKILSQRDIYKILPFGKTKTKQLLKSRKLPVVKIGQDFITTFTLMEQWLKENVGEEIYF